MDYKVADIGLAEFGRKEIFLAEKEMPALIAIRKKYEKEQRRKRKKISYYNIDSVQQAAHNVSIYTLKNHFNYIPPFGFQMSEQFARDVKHFFQKEFPL